MSRETPEIVAVSWGSIETTEGSFRDAKLWPGGAHGWDWNETGTHHQPGVQPSDVAELLDQDVEVILIGQGRHRRLEVSEKTRREIKEAGVRLEALETTAAVDRYRELVEDGVAVACLIHTTC